MITVQLTILADNQQTYVDATGSYPTWQWDFEPHISPSHRAEQIIRAIQLSFSELTEIELFLVSILVDSRILHLRGKGSGNIPLSQLPTNFDRELYKIALEGLTMDLLAELSPIAIHHSVEDYYMLWKLGIITKSELTNIIGLDAFNNLNKSVEL